jgi:hypothetical protein
LGILIGAILGALVGLFLAMTNHSAMVAAAQRAGLVCSAPIKLFWLGLERFRAIAAHQTAPGGGLVGGRVHALHANAAPDLAPYRLTQTLP